MTLVRWLSLRAIQMKDNEKDKLNKTGSRTHLAYSTSDKEGQITLLLLCTSKEQIFLRTSMWTICRILQLAKAYRLQSTWRILQFHKQGSARVSGLRSHLTDNWPVLQKFSSCGKPQKRSIKYSQHHRPHAPSTSTWPHQALGPPLHGSMCQTWALHHPVWLI